MTDTTVKHKDISWDFRSANTKEYTHCFHKYPAMMIPQISRRLLERYGRRGGWLLDPYCGTGTSLVEASLYGMNAVGCDINPLVRLVASAKTNPLSIQRLHGDLTEIQAALSSPGPCEGHVPAILNIEYWFSNDVIKSLSILRRHILSVASEAVRNFLWIAFSETVRECSYTKNGEFKLVRMAKEKLEGFCARCLEYLF